MTWRCSYFHFQTYINEMHFTANTAAVNLTSWNENPSEYKPSSSILWSVSASKSHSDSLREELPPTALLLVPSLLVSLWCNNLENLTVPRLSPCQVMGLLNDYHTCYLYCTPRCYTTRYQEIIPWHTVNPYLYVAVGIILLGVLDAVREKTRWCNESSTHQIKR